MSRAGEVNVINPPDADAPSTPSVVVMAKRPVPGRVKTRLTSRLTPPQAAAVHEAMMRCVLERVDQHLPGDHVLALDGDPTPEEPDSVCGMAGRSWRRMKQGEGDLGDRLARVWLALGGGPVIFLGVDAPDVPGEAMRAIRPALVGHDAAVGPTADGGYWTLASRQYRPSLLSGIDWGSGCVYDQTVEQTSRAGLCLTPLPLWHDVDEPADLDGLLHRLEAAREASLIRLRERLNREL